MKVFALLCASTALCTLGCVDPPRNGQFYTQEELENQETQLLLQRVMLGVAGAGGANLAQTPAQAAVAAAGYNSVNSVMDDQSRMLAAQSGSAASRAPESQTRMTNHDLGRNFAQRPLFYTAEAVDKDNDGRITVEEIRSERKSVFGSHQEIGIIAENLDQGTHLTAVLKNSQGRIEGIQELVVHAGSFLTGDLNFRNVLRMHPHPKVGADIEEYSVEVLEDGRQIPDCSLRLYIKHK